MLKVLDYYNFIDSWAPFDTAEETDNVGLLAGDMNDDVSGVLIALDITHDVIEEAKKMDANLIITHHPIIYGETLKCVTKSTASGSITYELAQNSMSTICAHTNLDKATGGVGDCFAELIGLKGILPAKSNPLIRVGELPKAVSLDDFARLVKEKTGAGRIQFSGKKPDSIKRVAVAGGGAGKIYMDAMITGADIYLTGTARHHEGLGVGTMGFCMMDVGHYETEVLVLPKLLSYLQICTNDVQSIGTISITSHRTGPFEVLC